MPAPQDSIDRGVAWVAVATAAVAVCDVVSLVLVLRLWLTPAEFGMVSAVVTLLPALSLLAELGLPAALIAGSAPDDTRCATAFWTIAATSAALYALLAALAPLLANAQGAPAMTELYRVAALVLLVRPAYLVQRALLRRALRFRELAYVRMAANVVELAVKVTLAFSGFGVWCLAIAPVARELIYALGVPACARWWPRLRYSRRAAAEDLRFGLRASAGELLAQLYGNLDYQVVSAAFGAAALGLYRAAYELVIEPVRFVSEVVTVVAFPAFARLRQDRAAVAAQLARFVRHNLAVVLPLLGLITVAAEELLTVLLGESYAAAAGAARILAVVGVLRALSHLGPPLLDGLGRPELTLRYHLAAAGALAIGFVTAAYLGHGYRAVAVAWALAYPVAFATLAILVAGQVALRAGVLAELRRLGLPLTLVTGAAAALASALPPSMPPAQRLALLAAAHLAACALALRALGVLAPRALWKSLRR